MVIGGKQSTFGKKSTYKKCDLKKGEVSRHYGKECVGARGSAWAKAQVWKVVGDTVYLPC